MKRIFFTTHCDHEPARAQCRAGVHPPQYCYPSSAVALLRRTDGGRVSPASVGNADGTERLARARSPGRRDACLTLNTPTFMEKGSSKKCTFAPARRVARRGSRRSGDRRSKAEKSLCFFLPRAILRGRSTRKRGPKQQPFKTNTTGAQWTGITPKPDNSAAR